MDQNKSKVESIIETLKRKLEAKERKLEKLNARPKGKGADTNSKFSFTNSRNFSNESIDSSLKLSSKVTSDGFRVPNPVKIINKTDGVAPWTVNISDETCKAKKLNEVEMLKKHGNRSEYKKTTSDAKFTHICKGSSFNLHGASQPKIDKMHNVGKYEESAPLFDSSPILTPINIKIANSLENKKAEVLDKMNVEITAQSDLLRLSGTSDSQKNTNCVDFEDHLATENHETTSFTENAHCNKDSIQKIDSQSRNWSNQIEEADSQQNLDDQGSRKSLRKRKIVDYAKILKRKRVKVDVTEIALLAFQILTQMAKDLPQEDFHLPLMYIQSNNRRLNLKELYTDNYYASELVNYSHQSPKAESKLNDTKTRDKTEDFCENEHLNSLDACLPTNFLCSDTTVSCDEDNLNDVGFCPHSNVDEAIDEETHTLEISNNNLYEEHSNLNLPISFKYKANQQTLSSQNELSEYELNERDVKGNEKVDEEIIEVIVEEKHVFEDEIADLPITLKNETTKYILSSDEELVLDEQEVIEAIDEKENLFEDKMVDLAITLKNEATEYVLPSYKELGFAEQEGDNNKSPKNNIKAINEEDNLFEDEMVDSTITLKYEAKGSVLSSYKESVLTEQEEDNNETPKKDIKAFNEEERLFEDEMVPITLKNGTEKHILSSVEKSVLNEREGNNNEACKEVIEANFEKENLFEDKMVDLPITLKNGANVYILSPAVESVTEGKSKEIPKETVECTDEEEHLFVDTTQALAVILQHAANDDASLSKNASVSYVIELLQEKSVTEGKNNEISKEAVEGTDEEENLFEDDPSTLALTFQNTANEDASMSKNVSVSNVTELLKEKSDCDNIGFAPECLKEWVLSQIDNEKCTELPEISVRAKDHVEEYNFLPAQVNEKSPNETEISLCKIIPNEMTPVDPETIQIAPNDNSNHNAEIEDIIGPSQEEPKPSFGKLINIDKCQEAMNMNKNEYPLPLCNDDLRTFVDNNSKSVLGLENHKNIKKNCNILKDIGNIREDVEECDINQTAAMQITMEREKCVENSVSEKVERTSCFRCYNQNPIEKIHFIETGEPLIVVQQSMSLTIFNQESKILHEICISMNENILHSFLIQNYIVLVIGGKENYLLIVNSNNFDVTKHSIPNCLPEETKILACPLEYTFFATCPTSSHSSPLTVHKIKKNGKIKSRELEKSEDKIIDILRVHNMERAIAGTMENGILFWSYYSGVLLRKVCFDEVVFPFRICWIYRDSSLFYYIVEWQSLKKNCLLVVNPITGKQQILVEYKNVIASLSKLDCFVTKVFYTKVIANEKLIIYNLLSGNEVAFHICAELSSANLVYKENQKHIVLTGYDNGCVHLFTI